LPHDTCSTDMHRAEYAMARYPSVRHLPVLYQNGQMDQDVFRHIGYP